MKPNLILKQIRLYLFFEDLKIESFINPKDHSQNHTRVSMEKTTTKQKRKKKKNRRFF